VGVDQRVDRDGVEPQSRGLRQGVVVVVGHAVVRGQDGE
jgi:hypothetical protein